MAEENEKKEAEAPNTEAAAPATEKKAPAKAEEKAAAKGEKKADAKDAKKDDGAASAPTAAQLLGEDDAGPAKIIKANSSCGPNFNARFAKGGANSVNSTIDTVPPINEAIAAAIKA